MAWLAGAPAHEILLRRDRHAGARRNNRWAKLRLPPAGAPDSCARATLVRIAKAASQIVAAYERYRPDEPWRSPDPGGRKRSLRYCPHHAARPGGAGL